MRRNPYSRKGVLILAACLSLVLLLAGTGMGLDVSRLIAARKQMRVRAETAALAAAMELDGTAEGVARAARIASQSDPESIEFAVEPEGVWSRASAAPAGVRMARVTQMTTVPLTLIRIVVDRESVPVRASAAAQSGGPQSELLAELLR